MDNQKKSQKIYESINDLFVCIFELKDSGKMEKYFRFLMKVPDHAPFNNTLVFIQNPECGYYATASQWKKRFSRTIKKDARPMVVLVPFGPVEFVYDISDTEGEPISDTDIINWWRENGGSLDEKIIENTRCNLEDIGVCYKHSDVREFFEEENFRTAGYAQRAHSDNSLSIALHPRYKKETVEAYGVLCHEIAHVLLGHLGQLVLPPKDGSGRSKEISKGRQDVPKHIKELEAELVAWIVFNSMGIEKNSDFYLATWLNSLDDFTQMSVSDVLKVAGKIQEMGKRKNVFR